MSCGVGEVTERLENELTVTSYRSVRMKRTLMTRSGTQVIIRALILRFYQPYISSLYIIK